MAYTRPPRTSSVDWAGKQALSKTDPERLIEADEFVSLQDDHFDHAEAVGSAVETAAAADATTKASAAQAAAIAAAATDATSKANAAKAGAEATAAAALTGAMESVVKGAVLDGDGAALPTKQLHVVIDPDTGDIEDLIIAEAN